MPHDTKTVLIAVNDIFFYTKIRDALLPQGYVLERARTQEEVPATAERVHPCAMILNMNDEKLNAFQALTQIKTHAQFKTLPVLAFANHEEVETWKRAKELGVTKIVSRNEFSSKTRELIEEIARGNEQ